VKRLKIVKVIPNRGFQATQFDGDVIELHEFLKGKAIEYNSLDVFDAIKKGDWLVSTYHGVITLSDADFCNNYVVVKGLE
jgi:hypothetical protein